MRKIIYLSTAICLAIPSNIVADNQPAPPSSVPGFGPTIKRETRPVNTDRIFHKYLEPQWADASVEWTDITPEYFTFHDFHEPVDKMMSAAPTPNYSGFREEPTNNWILNLVKAEGKDLSKGMIFLSGGIVHADEQYDRFDKRNPKPEVIGRQPDQRQAFINGITTFDFGDQVGNVLVYNGYNSNLNRTILPAGYYENNLVDAKSDFINFGGENGMQLQNNDWTLFFLPVDFDKYYTYINSIPEEDQSTQKFTIRVITEFNTCPNTASAAMNALGDINGILDNVGYVIRNCEDISKRDDNVQVKVTDGCVFTDYDGSLQWDATTWMVYETNLIIDPVYFEGTANIDEGVPCVRIQFPNQNVNQTSYFIRNVKMFITKGVFTPDDSEYIPDARFKPVTYLLRPNQINVTTKKLFVDEWTDLEAMTMPRWATRDVRWVLVDSYGRQYQSLAGAPDEITDYIAEFDGATGRILPRQNGFVNIQAISLAEGLGIDDDNSPVQVRKVMSSVTRMPIYNVVHHIDINHEHHAASDDIDLIELSGNEATRVGYQLRTDQPLFGRPAKFDPETPLRLYVGDSEVHDVVGFDSNIVHGLNHTSDDALFDGLGAFDIAVSAEAMFDSPLITLRVADGREKWAIYADDARFHDGSRDGVADFNHYAEPKSFQMSYISETSHPLGTANAYGNWLICLALPFTFTDDFYYYVEPLISDGNDNRDYNRLNVKQGAFDWELEDDGFLASATDGSASNRTLRVSYSETDGFRLEPLAPGVTTIYLTGYYAGTYRSALADERNSEGNAAVAQRVNDSSPARHLAPLQYTDTQAAPSDEDVDLTAFPAYNFYDAAWEASWATLGEYTPSEMSFTVPYVVEINALGFSALDGTERPYEDTDIEYFSLQGIRIAEPAPGSVCIRRQGKNYYKIARIGQFWK